MNMKQFTLGSIAAGLMAIGSAASASTFAFNDAGTNVNVNFRATTGITADNDLGLGLGVQSIHYITGLAKDADNTLGLSIVGGPSRVTFTYLGYEAGNKNFSARAGGNLFVNGVSTVGDTASFVPVFDGLVDFSFGTTAPAGSVGEIFNNGGATPASADYAIGYLKISDTSYYVFFDDIAQGDRDFDDIGMRIDIEPVPLPAGILLLGTALAGFGVMRRRKQAA